MNATESLTVQLMVIPDDHQLHRPDWLIGRWHVKLLADRSGRLHDPKPYVVYALHGTGLIELFSHSESISDDIDLWRGRMRWLWNERDNSVYVFVSDNGRYGVHPDPEDGPYAAMRYGMSKRAFEFKHRSGIDNTVY